MSTTMYIGALCHDPPLSSDEVGQHTYDLRDIQKWIANRDIYLELIKRDMWPQWDTHWEGAAARFFSEHPTCELEIFDQYGVRYPLVGEKEGET